MNQCNVLNNRTSIEKKVSCIRKKTFCLQFCMEIPKGHQKSIINTSKVKNTKIYPMEFAGLTQNSEKIIETSNQPIKTKIFPKKYV
jgi:hypothetical protein